MEFLKTLLISCIPAIITGILSFLIAKSKANSEIEKLKLSNNHEISRLMEQHKVDIEHIREQHKLELESKEKDHKYRMEIMQKEHENELVRKESELENTAKYNAMGNIFNTLGNVLGGTMSAPDIQAEISKQIIDGLNKNK